MFFVNITEAIKYGAAFLVLPQYVIRGMEMAVYKCENVCDESNCDELDKEMMAELDEAVAYYTGSLETGDPDSGMLMYYLADRRAPDFKTAGEDADTVNGTSATNIAVMREFTEFKRHLGEEKDCIESERKKKHVVRNMIVPLIQGALRYAHMRQNESPPSNRTVAEGAVWAASVLPWINYCSDEDAHTIHENLKISPADTKVDFAAVKMAFENTYKCLGISCAQVGGLWDVEKGAYREDAAPCSDQEFVDTNDDNQATDADKNDSGNASHKDTDGDIDQNTGSSTGSSSSSSTNDDNGPSKAFDDRGAPVDESVSSTRTSSSGSSTQADTGGSNAGLAFGMIVLFVVAALMIFLYVKSKKRQQKKKESQPAMVVFKEGDMC